MDVNLQNYIAFCLKKGFTTDIVKNALLKAGWQENTVDQAIIASQKTETQNQINLNLKMWKGPIMLTSGLLLFTNFYNVLYFGALTVKGTVEATAGAAALMIGISFLMSSISYYFDFLDNKIAYRKEIGLIGYYLALIYSFLLAFTNPEKYFFGFFNNLNTPDFILGLGAMTIFTVMTIVSINKVMVKVTPALTRKILRLGYFAYFLLITRAVVLEHETWLYWIESLDKVPPARFIVTIFASFIIILRLTMALSIYTREKSKKSVNN